MPDSLPGLVNYKETHVDVSKRLKKWSLPLMYGGVNMEMDITERQFRADPKLNKMRKAVISARPDSDALTWVFKFR